MQEDNHSFRYLQLRQLGGQLVLAGILAGLFGGLFALTGSNVWVLLLFLPIGIVVEGTRQLAVGHPPTPGMGCLLPFICLGVGGVLWIAGLWPFAS